MRNRARDLQVIDGMATLGPELLEARSLLDGQILAWAAQCGARPMSFPPLLRTADLAGLDYFQNFPHLAFVVSPIAADRLEDAVVAADSGAVVAPEALSPGGYCLPSAACYSVYLHLRERRLAAPEYVTTVATCYRNEVEYQGLKRLRAFTMREIVCLGSFEDAEAHLAAFRERITGLAERLRIPLEVQAATDPFYQGQEARRQMQLLVPVKHEFVYGGTVAIASLNVHRNFFGERCRIVGADGAQVSSSCVAFGLERWLHALLDRLGEAARVLEAVRGGVR